jgi:MFS family permease
LLTREERTLGNSILQSGAAIGAILTPLIVMGLLGLTGSWRYPFMVVGALGMTWSFFWLSSVRKEDLEISVSPSSSLMSILGVLVALLALDVIIHISYAPAPGQQTTSLAATWIPLGVKIFTTVVGILCVYAWLERSTRDESVPAPGEPPPLPRWLFIRRFWVLAVVTVTINAAWHFFRAWLPPFLRNQHGYSRDEVGWFSTCYYLATDAGSLLIGFAVLGLTRWGMRVHSSRVLMFAICAGITCLSLAAAVLPAGYLLLGVLLLIGFGALGLFPNYYSFTQELTVKHQGKVTGALGCVCWLSMALLHELAGESVMRTGSYSQGMALAGLLPLAGLAALVLFWGRTPVTEALPEEEEIMALASPAPTRVASEALRAAPSEVRE